MELSNTEVYHQREDLPAALAKFFLVLLSSVFAVSTVITHLSQVGGMRFNVYVIVTLSAALIMTVVVVRFEYPKIRSSATKNWPVLAALLACCLFSVALCQFSYRPWVDDSFYLPPVVYYLENPDQAMGFAARFIDNGGGPLVSYHRGSTPFEFSQAAFAHATKSSVLTVYYVTVPAILGFAIALVWFYLLSRFVKSTLAAVFGTLLICVCLLLMGTNFQSFGNYAFTRIFEGKAVVLAVGVPFFTALTIDFFRFPRVRGWLYLLALATSLVGLTVAATPLVPVLATVLAVACSFSFVRGWRRRVVVTAAYLSSLVYPAIYAATIVLFSMGDVGTESALNKRWPLTFFGHAKFVWTDPTAIILLLIGTITAIRFLKSDNRRFLVIWLVAIAVMFLNPLVAPYVIKYVTSPNLYWRVFYLLPFPLVIGLSGAALVTYLGRWDRKWRVIVPGAVIVGLLLVNVPRPSFSVFHRASLRAPGHKVMQLSVARKVLELSPPAGSMLAPRMVSQAVAVLTSRHRHICYRRDGIALWLKTGERSREKQVREMASHCLGGRVSARCLFQVQWLLNKHPQITTVVAKDNVIVANDNFLKSLLRRLGFTELGRADDMVVFTRPGSSS
jgi:hypothetical protein